MADAYSVSVSRGGDVTPEHDARVYTPKNAEATLKDRNITILGCPDLAAAVNDFYGPAIQRYNDKQKRASRKKSEDYYTALLNGEEGYGKGDTQEQPVYEYVFQVGNRDDNGVTDTSFDVTHWQELKKAGKLQDAAAYVQTHLNRDASREEMKDALNTVGGKLQDRFPYFKMLYIEGHDDEPDGTYHLHVAFTPWIDGQKTGLDTRVSLRKAAEAMGYEWNGGEAIKAWQRDVKDMIAEEMESRGYSRQYMSNTEEHFDVNAWKVLKENERLLAENERLQAEKGQLVKEKHALQAENGMLRGERDQMKKDIARGTATRDALRADLGAIASKAREKAPEAEKPPESDLEAVYEVMKHRTLNVNGQKVNAYDHYKAIADKERAERARKAQEEQAERERIAREAEAEKRRQDAEAEAEYRREEQRKAFIARQPKIPRTPGGRPMPDISHIQKQGGSYDGPEY